MLIVEGALGPLDLARHLAQRDRRQWGRRCAVTAAFGLFVGALVLPVPRPTSTLPALAVIVPGVVGLALLAAAVWPERRIVQLAAPLLALALVELAGTRTNAAFQSRAAFQRPQMLRAREAFARLVERGSVVITTEEVGRPAENIDYYSGVARALYLTDIDRWRLPIAEAVRLFLRAGMPPYLFLPADDRRLRALVAELEPVYGVELVADVPPQQAMDHFVAAAFHRGVRMHLYRITRRTS
jgi:hypothetical protein